jgi:hypothetical protein
MWQNEIDYFEFSWLLLIGLSRLCVDLGDLVSFAVRFQISWYSVTQILLGNDCCILLL